VPVGTVDAVLSYCHNNLADNTLQVLLPYLQEKKVAVISASFSSMGLLTQKVRALREDFHEDCSALRVLSHQCARSDPLYPLFLCRSSRRDEQVVEGSCTLKYW
jgi:aryl-alcohol dehydrogenase-like predicted oxidoreductase